MFIVSYIYWKAIVKENCSYKYPIYDICILVSKVEFVIEL